MFGNILCNLDKINEVLSVTSEFDQNDIKDLLNDVKNRGGIAVL